MNQSYIWTKLILESLISWPAVGLLAMFLFKGSIISLLGRIRHLKVAQFEVPFIEAAREARVSSGSYLRTREGKEALHQEIPNDVRKAWNAVVLAAREYLARNKIVLSSGKPPETVLEIMSLLPGSKAVVFEQLKQASGLWRDRTDSASAAGRRDFVEAASNLIADLENAE